MTSSFRRSLAVSILVLVGMGSPAASQSKKTSSSEASSAAPALTADHLKGLELRNIGPAIMGGRIDDFAVVEGNPSTFYVGTASGGILKTTNNGTTFEAVFDAELVSSIGDLTLAPSDPQVLYVGTGEPNNRQSSSWGNGVYRTLDGGKTWQHLGLAETHHIGRVLVHPRDQDVVYVAALGRLWGPNRERGLYKTTDGGRSWTNTKFVDEDTGFVDVAMDPQSPDTLYAASYQRRRTPMGYNGGGPGSGLWKTIDGGASWTKLTKGLPEGELGRIGIAVYQREPNVVYALVEHAKEGGTYRSDDRGLSFSKLSSTNPRPSYYSKLRIDPNSDRRIWVMGAPMFTSEDGGRTFKTDVVDKIHGDYHAMWINPANSDHMLVGSDGGIHLSYDRGRSWDFANTVPLAQFYEVALDNQRPYHVYGGLQDNGSWSAPSRTLYRQGIANDEWVRVGGGDGFYTVPDPTDADIVYVETQDGNLQRLHRASGQRRLIRPEPKDSGERYRFNWNSPVLVSPHDAKTIYYGGNRLFGSRDRGDSWTIASPDLTSSDNVKRDATLIFGKTAKELLSRNDGVVHVGTITTIAESPLKPGVLWAGTDDGNLHVSRDGGASFTSVAARVPGVPKGTYVSRVEASRSGEGAAYVAFDGHRANDFAAYLFFTADYGQTWKSVASNLPAGGTLSVVREHPKNPDVLFAGTERGLWVSWDRGSSWTALRGKNFPTVPVDDLQIHARDGDLVLGTHGRGVWILDDAAPLVALPQARGKDLHLFPVPRATAWRLYEHKGNTGHKLFLAPNPPEGALVTYWIGAKPGDKDEVTLTVSDASGALVRELKGPKPSIGMNRASWDLRREPPVKPEEGAPQGFGGPPRGPLVLPGTYTLKVAAGGKEASETVVVEDDPRIAIGEAERREWYDAQLAAGRVWTKADAADKAVKSLKKQLEELKAALEKKKDTPAAVTKGVQELVDKTAPLARRLSLDTPTGFAGAPLAEDPEPLLPRARALGFGLAAFAGPPTAQQKMVIERTTSAVDEVAAAIQSLQRTDVPALNKLIYESGIGKIDPGTLVP
ncbi:MAG TPA: glycosyl hydrolase [Vicinamibacteria bacterium]